MMQRLTGYVSITIFMLAIALCPAVTHAQIAGTTSCNGSLGEPIVNVTFGAGPNFAPPLGAAITGLQYVATTCPGDGQYTIVNYTANCFAGNWHTTADHTGNGNGYFILINASFQPSDFYVQTVDGLCDGTTYQFSAWILNMLVDHGILPEVTFSIEKTDGTILGSYTSGKIPMVNPATWNQYGFYFTTPPGISRVVIRMHNNAPGGNGNDLGLDDIVFRPAGPSIKAGFSNQTGDSAIVCSFDKDSLRLNAVVDNCYVSTAYQWRVSTTGGTTWVDIPGATSKDIIIPPATAGTYLYRLTVAQAGNIHNATCSVASAPLKVIVKDIPAAAPAIMISTADTNVCTGAPVTFNSVSTSAGSSPSYQWLVNGTAAATSNATFVTRSLRNGDRISCMMTSNAACLTNATATSNSITVALAPLVVPEVDITASVNNVCGGTPVTFTAQGTNGGNLPVYTWEVNGIARDKGMRFTATNLRNGDVVRCSMKNNAVCATTDVSLSNNIPMVIFPLPGIRMETNKTIFRGTGVQLAPVVTGSIAAYTWTPAAGLDNANTAHPVAGPLQTTVYTLQVVSTDGCRATASITVEVITRINVPNVFSPNGDGINDTWVVNGLQDYQGSTVDVFNRYGQLVFHAAGYGAPWKGDYNGQPLPAGTYYYIIDPKKGFPVITGPVTIVR